LRRFLPRLAAAGWSGGNEQLAAPPLAIRVNEPNEARAVDLARLVEDAGTSAGESVDEPPAPNLDSVPRAVPVGHLSYSSLADYERCGYRFYAERVLGLAPGALHAAGDNAGVEDDAKFAPD